MVSVARAAATVVIAITVATPVSAQSAGIWEVGVQGMADPGSSRPNSVFLGATEGVRQEALAIRATTDLLRLGRLRVRYSAQLLPAMQLRNVERYAELANDQGTTYIITGTGTSRGIGFVPIGLDLNVQVAPRLRVQTGAGIGIAWFSQNVPVAGARQRNFIAEWDVQLAVDLRHGRALQLGTRWRHLSNGLTAFENPGVDNRLLFAGMSWRVRAPR
jgi:hypothetical protein